jgi:hypothetical protein
VQYPIALLLFLETLILSSACTHYLDKDKSNDKVVTKDYELNILEHKNVFIYTSEVNVRMDDQVLLTTKFKLDLPKHLKTFEFSNMHKFIFYYPNKQYFVIYMDNEKKTVVTSDMLYTPDEKELKALIEQNDADIIKKEKSNGKSRKSFVFKRKNAAILLYNIKKDKIDTFISCAKSLEFI